MTSDRPATANPQAPAKNAPRAPAEDQAAPPITPEPGQSPWWSAPSGKPFGIPDFAHEFVASLAAQLVSVFDAPQPIPARVKARRR